MARNGGDLVVETLTALGAGTVFGIPGQHALGLFDALSRSELSFVSSRVENNAAFAADGFARATGKVAVLFLSTGPGALTALAGLEEAYATGVPIVVVSSQIPRAGLGGRRKGMLHQLDEQRAAAAQVTKWQRTVFDASSIAPAIADAWAQAVTAPAGPVWVEVPQDVLLEEVEVPASTPALVARPVEPAPELVAEAARLLTGADRVAIVAGGGVRRAGAEAALIGVAEALGAPVACSPGGHGAFPWTHPLSLQSWVEDRHVTRVLEEADVLLVLGSALGQVTSNYFTLAPRGRVVQVDADERVLGSNHTVLGIRADAGEFLRALASLLPSDRPNSAGQALAAQTLAQVEARLDAQDLRHERAFLDRIRAAVPDDMQTFWDMTIAAYWAWSCWDSRGGEFHSGQGAGGLGFAYPAAIGGSLGLRDQGRPERVLAVAGDGSAMYSIAELATARQHDAAVTWLIVDDGGYGILREYMQDAFGAATHTELTRPDFAALAATFGIPAVTVAPEDVEEALRDALAATGPNVVVVPTLLRMFAPTHLDA
ncbi:acetolactate synthase-1/2/3 large subunit [Kineosphaera limosa]|uniref:Putative acetolactate synthase large subunit n=1 Tax=Kineosphaera limosa NBRC 100340 TaxID=1184609 RepID=K6X897_9MICO|nr:thiamine pyrophosphate-binding protein [Kineosphaera limosa]NYE00485.1 acetolactate synthase-1/2/3 large subunit [Kineosphaera limosa]GAB95049.1 putative acetolactate synthase large subunit [Kineosphaera limosa NBRC 100340]